MSQGVIGIDQKVDMMFKKLFNLKGHTSFGTVELQPAGELQQSNIQITSEQVWSRANLISEDRNPLNPGDGSSGGILSPGNYPQNSNIDDAFGIVPGKTYKRNDLQGNEQRNNIAHTTKGDAYLSRPSSTQQRLTFSIDGENIYERIIIPLEYVPFSKGSWRYVFQDNQGTIVDELDLLNSGVDTANTLKGAKIIPYTFRPDAELTDKTNGANSLFSYMIGHNPNHIDALNGIFTRFVGVITSPFSGNWYFDQDALQLNFFAMDDAPTTGDSFISDFFGGALTPFTPTYAVTDTGASSGDNILFEDQFDINNKRILTPANNDTLYVVAYRYIGPLGGNGSGGGGNTTIIIEDAVKCTLFQIDNVLDTTSDSILGGFSTPTDKLNYLATGVTSSTPYVIMGDGINVAGLTDSNGLGLSQSEIYYYDTTLISWVLDTDDNTFGTNYIDGTRFLLEPISGTVSLPFSVGGMTPSGYVDSTTNNSFIQYDGTTFAGDVYSGSPDSWTETVPTTGMRTMISCDANKVVEWNGNKWVTITVQDTFCHVETEQALVTSIDGDYASNNTLDYEPIVGCMHVSINGVIVDETNYLFGSVNSTTAITPLSTATSSFTVTSSEAPLNTEYLLMNGSITRSVVSVTTTGATSSVVYSGDDIPTLTSVSKIGVIFNPIGEYHKNDIMFWNGSVLYELDATDSITWTYDTTEEPI